MSGAALVSVVISNYNYSHFLADAIDSALRQTWPHTEVIVVDDGSTDNSREVIASYGDRVLPVFKENRGMDTALNAGFAASTGEVVLFVDADDVLLPGAVANAVSRFTSPDVVKVHWPLREIDGSGRPTGRIIPERALLEGDLRPLVINGGPDAYISPPTSGNAWSRRFLTQVFPIPEPDYKRHAEMYLVTLASVYGVIRSVGEPQGCYRIHGTNDYACRPMDEKNRRNYENYLRRCDLLKKALRLAGIEVGPGAWQEGNLAYDWMHRRHVATQELATLVPAGESFIFVDEQQWADPWAKGPTFTDRFAIPFLERHGRYWGRPADDPTAIRELERLRLAGAVCIAFAWPAFWWLECYPELHRHLRSKFACVLQNDNLVVFDLRRSA